MFPKKIYLNYDGEEMWSGESASVTDCDTQTREYTDLNQVWHNASEEPQGEYEIMCQDEFENIWLTEYCETNFRYEDGWKECAERERITRWAYIKDLLPKGGEK